MNEVPPTVGPTPRLADVRSIYMHVAYFLTGVGVLMLGPLLPQLSQVWGLADSRSGMLLAAQFAGSFTGAVLLRKDLRQSLTLGAASILCGYTGLGLAAWTVNGFPLAVLSVLVGGFGIGQLINAISVVAGWQYGIHRGRMLMSLNLIWSAGALLAPLLIGVARGHVATPVLLLIFASGSVALLILERAAAFPLVSPPPAIAAPTPASLRFLLGYFAILFFLHGALENSVSGWLATYAVRYAHASVSIGAYSTTMLWIGILAGRGFALLLLRRFTEKQLQLAGALAAIVTSALVQTIDTPASLLTISFFLGCSLSPFIPVTSSLFLAHSHPSPRQAGFVMASAALGGMVLPWMIGAVSQHFHSLRMALELPIAVGALLFGLCIASLLPVHQKHLSNL